MTRIYLVLNKLDKGYVCILEAMHEADNQKKSF